MRSALDRSTVRLKALKTAVRELYAPPMYFSQYTRDEVDKWMTKSLAPEARDLTQHRAEQIDLRTRLIEWRKPLSRPGGVFLPPTARCVHCFCVKRHIEFKAVDYIIGGRLGKSEQERSCENHKIDFAAALLRIDK